MSIAERVILLIFLGLMTLATVLLAVQLDSLKTDLAVEEAKSEALCAALEIGTYPSDIVGKVEELHTHGCKEDS